MKNKMRYAKAVLAVLIAVVLLPIQAFASGTIEVDRECSLNITYKDESLPLTSVTFSIYKIADVDPYGGFTVTPDFSGYNVNIHGNNDEAWKTLAFTLDGYVRHDSLTPVETGLTDSNGDLSFSSLSTGLYLVLGDRHVQYNTVYDPSPLIVMLPAFTEDGWSYTQTVDPKSNYTHIPSSSDVTMTRKVLKIWQDDGYEDDRPHSITVHLLRDGRVWDSVVLSDENNWRYTWAGLSSDNVWSVIEDVPQDFSVEITRQGITYVVQNTHSEEVPDDPPTESDTPDAIDEPDTPDEPPQDVEIPKEDELPQTGQLWWPVPILLCSGLFLMAIGIARRKGDINEEN